MVKLLLPEEEITTGLLIHIQRNFGEGFLKYRFLRCHISNIMSFEDIESLALVRESKYLLAPNGELVAARSLLSAYKKGCEKMYGFLDSLGEKYLDSAERAACPILKKSKSKVRFTCCNYDHSKKDRCAEMIQLLNKVTEDNRFRYQNSRNSPKNSQEENTHEKIERPPEKKRKLNVSNNRDNNDNGDNCSNSDGNVNINEPFLQNNQNILKKAIIENCIPNLNVASPAKEDPLEGPSSAYQAAVPAGEPAGSRAEDPSPILFTLPVDFSTVSINSEAGPLVFTISGNRPTVSQESSDVPFTYAIPIAAPEQTVSVESSTNPPNNVPVAAAADTTVEAVPIIPVSNSNTVYNSDVFMAPNNNNLNTEFLPTEEKDLPDLFDLFDTDDDIFESL